MPNSIACAMVHRAPVNPTANRGLPGRLQAVMVYRTDSPAEYVLVGFGADAVQAALKDAADALGNPTVDKALSEAGYVRGAIFHRTTPTQPSAYWMQRTAEEIWAAHVPQAEVVRSDALGRSESSRQTCDDSRAPHVHAPTSVDDAGWGGPARDWFPA